MADTPTRDEVRAALKAATVVALAITKSRQHAEELVQEAFERGAPAATQSEPFPDAAVRGDGKARKK